MQAKLVRCAICLFWHSPKHHCQNCGAFHVTINRVTKHYNRQGVEMVRGIPIPLHQTIKQNWNFAERDE